MSIYHPDFVNGRRLWMGSEMRDLIHKLHHGDPTIGWEGDPMLAVTYDMPARRWVLERLEDDGVYREVCRSPVDGLFDERVLWDLCQWDRNRRTVSVHDEVMQNNARVDAELERQRNELFREELTPRLAHALREDADW